MFAIILRTALAPRPPHRGQITRRFEDKVLVRFAAHDEWLNVVTDCQRFAPLGFYTEGAADDVPFALGAAVQVVVARRASAHCGAVCAGRVVRVEAMQVCVEYEAPGSGSAGLRAKAAAAATEMHWYTVYSPLIRLAE
jgi:hypothetical protein